MDGGETRWIIANWKSKQPFNKALEWVSEVGPKLENKPNLKVVVCPPFDELSEVKKAVDVGNYPLMVGSQDISPFPPGAETGEEPAAFLKQFVSLAIIGHSERRQHLGETDELIAKKVDIAKQEGVIPLLCVQGVETPIPTGVEVIAYEPISAIGTGHPDTPENANQVASQIKAKLTEPLPILYGGSVTSQNVAEFLAQSDIAGVLVGGASLDPVEFLAIVENSQA